MKPNQIAVKVKTLYGFAEIAGLCMLLVILQLNGYAQAYNNGPMYISGNAYLAASFTNSNAVATNYSNNGSFSITGDFTNNQPTAMAAGTGIIAFVGTSLENINGTQPSNFYNATVNNTSNVKMGDNITINNIYYPKAGSLQINGNTLTLAGTINNTGTGTITADAAAAGTSNINITGTAALGTLNFSGSNYYINNFTLNRTSTGTATMGTNMYVYGNAAMNNGALVLNSHALSLSGSVTGTGTFTGDNTATMNILGTSNTSLGTLYFTTGGQNLNLLTVNRWNSTTVANAATLGTSLTTNNLTLTEGILSTNINLLTLTASSGLTAPNVPWVSGSTTFGNSYVATCDATGTPIAVANNTTPLTGAYGFQINNIGTGGTTTEVYFPVGASFLPAGTSVTAPTPNRMSIKNQGPADNFNVVVNYGDIDNTPNARVNRIWYVNSANSTPTSAPDKVSMKLFFVNRPSAGWPSSENEVENTPAPFDYTSIALVEKDYTTTDPNFIAISGGSPLPGDLQNFPNGTYNGQEVYAQYTVGTSPDYSGAMNGLFQFNRFSITSPSGIILPVKVINFRAYQQGSGVQTSWTCLNELNMDHYEVQRSADASDFFTLGSEMALNNGLPSINYSFYDAHPLQGDNYYRIKIIGKDGSISYTNVDVVFIGGGLSSINIFPNPVTQHIFTLQLNNINAGKYSLLIYNTLGQLLLNQEIDHAGGSASQTVYLPAGTARGEYHVQLLGTNLQVNKTLTVQ